jgi:diaminohydroxyphosphoribosylaminopyrimidine deaminase/5-amino-6-(5-phosphoribosylamino)uracil reductase
MVEFLDIALTNAYKYLGLTYPNPAVGAVITDDKNTLISIGVHKLAGLPHAEVEAIKEAYFKLTRDDKILSLTNSQEIHNFLYKNHNGIFKDKTIYVTLEPCNHFGKTPPCSMLIANLGFKKVVIGVKDNNKLATGAVEFLEKEGLHVEVLNSSTCRDLIEPFEMWQKERFVFFKLAMSNNGVISGGIITCKESREFVHNLRDKCDLLVIGGNTVRTDKPILDARMCGGKAPDVLIYSKRGDFDREIPLFKVPNRKVFIEDNFSKLDEYNFIMIEGGEGMLKATFSFVNHYLIFRSPNLKAGITPQIELNLKELCSFKIAQDRCSWFKKQNA